MPNIRGQIADVAFIPGRAASSSTHGPRHKALQTGRLPFRHGIGPCHQVCILLVQRVAWLTCRGKRQGLAIDNDDEARRFGILTAKDGPVEPEYEDFKRTPFMSVIVPSSVVMTHCVNKSVLAAMGSRREESGQGGQSTGPAHIITCVHPSPCRMYAFEQEAQSKRHAFRFAEKERYPSSAAGRTAESRTNLKPRKNPKPIIP